MDAGPAKQKKQMTVFNYTHFGKIILKKASDKNVRDIQND